MKSISDGENILNDVVKMITSGKSPSKDSIEAMRNALTHYQAKMDLVGVGLTLQQMDRVTKLSQMIGDIEDSLIGNEGEAIDLMETKDKIALLKTFHTDFRNTSNHLAERAVKPTISSPDTMKKVPDGGNEVVEETTLGVGSRTKIMGLFERLAARASTVDVEVEEVESKKKKED